VVSGPKIKQEYPYPQSRRFPPLGLSREIHYKCLALRSLTNSNGKTPQKDAESCSPISGHEGKGLSLKDFQLFAGQHYLNGICFLED